MGRTMDESVSILKAKQPRKPKKELESRSFKDGAIYLFKRADYKKPTWFCLTRRCVVPNALYQPANVFTTA